LQLAAAAVAVVVELGMFGRNVSGVCVPLHHVGDDGHVELENRGPSVLISVDAIRRRGKNVAECMRE
jgi:hypothetical protein